MRIRSVTIGANVDYLQAPPAHIDASRFRAFEQSHKRGKTLLEDARLTVQTVRLATQPFPEILRDSEPADAVPFSRELEALCQNHGIDFVSL